MKTAAYPKIIALGGVGIGTIFDEPVEITEKLDGSQFGFGMVDGELIVRSKGKEQDLYNPDKMFKEGVEYILDIKDRLADGLFFYGEYLQKPRHSTLAYNNIPKNHISLFGVMDTTGDEVKMWPYETIAKNAELLGVDVVPLLWNDMADAETVQRLLKRESYLGGQDIEGVVVKNYKPWLYMDRFPYTVMAGKFVTEKFKEVHQKDWSSLNTGKGKLEGMKDKYRSEARWHKAVMRLKEEGRWTQSLKDIGEIMKLVRQDLIDEEKDNIKRDFWNILGDDIVKYSSFGVPEWYKLQLLEGENGTTETHSPSVADANISEV